MSNNVSSKCLDVVIYNTGYNSDQIYCRNGDPYFCLDGTTSCHVISGGNPARYGEVTDDIFKAMNDEYNKVAEDLHYAHTLTFEGYRLNEIFESPLLYSILECASLENVSIVIKTINLRKRK